jgi:hypothetical protein
MPKGILDPRIHYQLESAQYFLRLSRERHQRAAALARRALEAQKKGRPQRAQTLMEEALELKAAAGQAALRSRLHRARVKELREEIRQKRAATR